MGQYTPSKLFFVVYCSFYSFLLCPIFGRISVLGPFRPPFFTLLHSHGECFKPERASLAISPRRSSRRSTTRIWFQARTGSPGLFARSHRLSRITTCHYSDPLT